VLAIVAASRLAQLRHVQRQFKQLSTFQTTAPRSFLRGKTFPNFNKLGPQVGLIRGMSRGRGQPAERQNAVPAM